MDRLRPRWTRMVAAALALALVVLALVAGNEALFQPADGASTSTGSVATTGTATTGTATTGTATTGTATTVPSSTAGTNGPRPTGTMAADATTMVTAAAAAARRLASHAAGLAEVDGDGVRRALVIGDSLVVMAEDQIRATFAAHGVEVTFDAVSGTGLLTDQAVRTRELAVLLATLRPDVVIVESCCNYDGSYTADDGTTVAPDSPAMFAAWRQQARLMVAMSAIAGADVRFVVTPRSTSPLQGRIERFNEIYRSLGVPVIDWDAALFAGASDDRVAALHVPDGLHLADAADAMIAQATWDAVAGRFAGP